MFRSSRPFQARERCTSRSMRDEEPSMRTVSLYAWVLSAALAACGTPAQWEKPGATAAGMQQDSERCREEARLASLPSYLAPAAGQTADTTALSRDQQRTLRETEAYQKCMRERGYSASR